MDPRTPVLVGSAAVVQQVDEPGGGVEAVELMARAAEQAAGRAGRPSVLHHVDRIVVPRGTWSYRDPGRILAERLGCPGATTVVAELGVLQSALVNAATARVAAGADRLVLVAGGEARHRARLAQKAGVDAPDTVQDASVVPDEVIAPGADVIHPVEVRLRMVQAVEHYAILENATRYHDGLSVAAQRARIAELWQAFNSVAVDNPYAWDRRPTTVDELSTPSERNRPLTFPYCSRHVSQWNVDQAAALLLCTAGTARELGLAEDGWVFPMAGADSDHMVPVVARQELWRCPGAGVAGRVAMAAAGVAPGDLDLVDLYSCFPIAVLLQARELGLDPGRPLTVGGGMTFAGGPFNNAVLQATARTAELLTSGGGGRALVTAVSGMLTKQGCTVWSSSPPAEPFAHLDVTSEVAALTAALHVTDQPEGSGTIAGYTVRYDGRRPALGLLVLDLPDGTRGMAVVRDEALARSMTEEEWCGRSVRVGSGGVAEA